MIGYCCTNCDHTFSVQDDYLGKRIKCPRCSYVGVVVDDSGRIKIICQNCGNENNVPETLSGQEIKCPKCDNVVVAAPAEKEPAGKSDVDLLKESLEAPRKSEFTERNLIIIISVIAALIVIGLIIMAAVRSGN